MGGNAHHPNERRVIGKMIFLSFSEILRVQCVEDRGIRRKSETIAHEQYKRLGS